MRSIASGGLAAAVILAAAGCAAAGSGGPSAPDAPIVTGSAAQAALADLPVVGPDSAVLAVTTVVEQVSGDLLCIGAVAESAPPQCSGLELLGWEWDVVEHQQTGGVRWTQGVAIEGVYASDAQSFFATGEPMSAAAITLPAIEVPAGELDEATIDAVLADLATIERADVLGSQGEAGTVVLDMVFDDGAVQAALDDLYGAGVVFVRSALHAAEPPSALPAPSPGSAAPVVTGEQARARLAELPLPSATGPVLAVGTVLEAASGHSAGVPVLCHGVLASLPPQCGGSEVIGWDWSAIAHEEASDVRWADRIAMRVTYDATANAVTVVEMLDPETVPEEELEMPTGSLDPATAAAVQEDLHSLGRADVFGSGTGTGAVLLEVVYDDGSMQAALDDIYGRGVVHVESRLR